MPVDDSYSKLLLHCDGADGSPTFVDEAGKTVTPNGSAQIDTAQSKFGGASGYFNGSTDYLTVPDSADWWLDDGDNSKKWTIDFWFRTTASGSSQHLVGQFQTTNNFWRIAWLGSYFQVRSQYSGTNEIDLNFTASLSNNTWYHIALVKDGVNGYGVFLGGSRLGSWQIDTSPLRDLAGYLLIGSDNARYMYGWMDEIRVSKGVARWTSNFTPPSAAYGAGGVMFRRNIDGVGRIGVRSVA